MSEPPTRLIERQHLDALIEDSRAGTRLAHTVRRSRERASGRGGQPSALRGLAIVIAIAMIVRVLVGWIFY